MNSKINLETFLKLVKENEKILVTRGYEKFNDNEFYCGECKEFLDSMIGCFLRMQKKKRLKTPLAIHARPLLISLILKYFKKQKGAKCKP